MATDKTTTTVCERVVGSPTRGQPCFCYLFTFLTVQFVLIVAASLLCCISHSSGWFLATGSFQFYPSAADTNVQSITVTTDYGWETLCYEAKDDASGSSSGRDCNTLDGGLTGVTLFQNQAVAPIISEASIELGSAGMAQWGEAAATISALSSVIAVALAAMFVALRCNIKLFSHFPYMRVMAAISLGMALLLLPVVVGTLYVCSRQHTRAYDDHPTETNLYRPHFLPYYAWFACAFQLLAYLGGACYLGKRGKHIDSRIHAPADDREDQNEPESSRIIEDDNKEAEAAAMTTTMTTAMTSEGEEVVSIGLAEV